MQGTGTRYVRRFAMAFALFLVLPVLMGTVFFAQTVNLRITLAMQEQQSRLLTVRNIVEEIDREARAIASIVSIDRSLHDLGSRENLFQSPNLSELIRERTNTRLVQPGLVSDYVLSHFVYFPTSRAIFTNETALPAFQFYRYLLRFDSQELRDFDRGGTFTFHYGTERPVSLLPFGSTNETRTVPMFHSFQSGRTSRGLAVILLDAPQILSLFDPVNLAADSSVAILNRHGNVLASRFSESYPASAVETALETMADESYSFRGGGVIGSILTVPDAGLQLLVVQPTEFLQRETLYIRNTTIIIIISFFIAGVLMAVILARLSSKPILSIVNDLKRHLDIDEVSTRDVHALVESAFGTLIHRTESLTDQIERERPFQRRLFLEGLLNGLIKNADEVRSSAARVGITWPSSGWFCVCTVTWKRGSGTQSEDEPTQKSRLQQTMLQGSLRDRWGDAMVAHEYEPGRLAVILSFADDTYAAQSREPAIEERVMSLQRILTSLGVERFCIGVGNPRSDPTRIYNSYRESQIALDRVLSLPSVPVYHYKDITSIGGVHFPLEVERRLIALAKSGSIEEMSEMIGILRRNHFETEGVGVEDQRLLCEMLKGTLVRIASGSRPGQDGLIEQVRQFGAAETQRTEVQFDTLTGMLLQTTRGFYQEIHSHNEILKKRVAEYITENFPDQNLSQRAVADHVGVSSGYLSTFYREHFGARFQEHLEAIRMEYVRQQLLHSDRTLGDIASDAGYASINTFSKAFRRYFGISATKYRASRADRG